jgi:hypothetical protein
MNSYSQQAESIHHRLLLEAQHNHVLQQIAALQQHSHDLQTKEQTLNAAILNEMSQNVVNQPIPIQSLLQQSALSYRTSLPFSSSTILPSWNVLNPITADFPNLVYPSQGDSLLVHLHKQAMINQQVLSRHFTNKLLHVAITSHAASVPIPYILLQQEKIQPHTPPLVLNTFSLGCAGPASGQ